ncbi:MAG TPA: radical SAM protein [Desulfuromonadaceae bacterium]|jgi:radical SAM superfamily enzyme YgiQ (UPF0313 family)
MKVSLIFTPNQLNPNYKEVAFRDNSIGLIPPLSLLCVAALLEKEGVEVQILDMAAEQLDYEGALLRLARFSPDLLGFSITTMSFHPVLQWIKLFKRDTGLPVMVGGEHVRLYPYETMFHQAIDYCIVGEAERPLPQFIKAFQEKRSFDGIKSLGFRSNGNLTIDCSLQAIDDLDTIPFPARHLINNDLYSNILTKKKNFTAMISSRGCPFRCAFCNANQQKYRVRSPQSFADEIELNLKEFNIREFDIYDSTFTTDPQRVVSICDEIQRRKLDVGFTVRSRVDVVSRELIDSLKRGGCHTIMFGIESSAPEILKMMRKGISPELVREAVAYTKQSGMETLGFFLFGFPGETRESIEATIRFSLELPLDYAQFNLLLPLPDTEIYSYYRSRGLEDYWAEYTLDELKNGLIELMDTGVTREETSRYITMAYRRFYYRPRIIFDRIKQLSSLSELQKLVKGAFGILANVGGKG